jgi:hypothetical protein
MKFKNYTQILTISISLITNHLTQAGCGPSKPKVIPTPAAIEETKADPQEAAAASKIQKRYRKHRQYQSWLINDNLQRVSTIFHRAFESERAKRAAGKRFDLEVAVQTYIVLELKKENWISNVSDLNVALATINRRWLDPRQAIFHSKELEDLHRLTQGKLNLINRSIICLDTICGLCALNRLTGQLGQNNSEYILSELYRRGLPKPKQTQIDSLQELK